VRYVNDIDVSAVGQWALWVIMLSLLYLELGLGRKSRSPYSSSWVPFAPLQLCDAHSVHS